MMKAIQKKLTLPDFTFIVISLVIGMGIFQTASTSASAAHTPLIYFIAWIAGGIIAFCGAITFAEIGSRYPVTGGYFRLFSHAYHPSIAFSINCIILISNAASLAGVALIGAGYISRVINPSSINEGLRLAIAALAILIFYGVNLLGLKTSARTQNILMIIKISMIVLLIIPLFMPHLHVAENISSYPAISNGDSLKAFGAALVAVCFTYGGYQQTINFGEEVNNPSKNIPKAIFIGIFVIILLYLLVNYSYYRVLGFDTLQNGKGIAGLVVEKFLGQTAASLFSLLLFLSVLAYVNILLLSNPRVMMAMSEDGVLPAIFSKKNNNTGVCVISLTVFALMCLFILLFAQTFEKVLNFTIFLDCLGMVLAGLSIFKLRKTTAGLNKKNIFIMRAFPVQPLIFVAGYVFVAISISITAPAAAITGIIILLTLITIFFIIQWNKRRTTI